MATRVQATTPPSGLSPRASAVAVCAVVACLALLWPRLIAPPQDLSPNINDKATGCCDVFVDTDVNAIKVMTELCSSILHRSGGPIDSKTEQAFLTGKLTKEVISMCRQEVNTTCGIDIATFLDQNIRLGKTYKQILDEIRSYNGSTCLKTHYGIAPWSLGVPHHVGKFWIQGFDGMRQERSPHLRPAPVHPALRERGRAIVPPTGAPPSPSGPYQASAPFVQRGPAEGRVWSTPLNVYYVKETDEPMPIGGIRPPMGGAGGVVPAPKSSVGFVMPLYTLCIVIFFLYTVFKMVFRRQISPDEIQADPTFKPDPEFRRKVFTEPIRSSRISPDSNKLVVNAISGLVAEVRQQMEEYHQVNHSNITQEGSPHPYTNGSLNHSQKESSPIIMKTKEFLTKKEDSTPVQENNIPFAQTKESAPVEDANTHANNTNQIETVTPSEKIEQIHANNIHTENGEVMKEKLSEKPTPEEEIVRQVRSSVEKEKPTFKVLGMEMTAHCEGGQKWITPRPPTPPVHPLPRHPTPPVEVSSIYLEGALPHQSRLLVADSETHTEEINDGDEKDAPIILSGKMTLSVINDELIKAASEKEYVVDDLTYENEDDDFTTASAATAPKQNDAELDESEEEVEEEEIEEEIEVDEEVEVEVDEEVEVEVDEEVEVEVDEEVEVEVDEEVEEEEEEEEAEEESDKEVTKVEKKKIEPAALENVEYEEIEVEVETDEDEEGTDEEAEKIIKNEKANNRT
ncbi:uncharacterized protein LOC143920508 isoform X3 [Arctopsyche grandis]|uniref:uncharacterized protein LOC143920508 isoform X3 n=1 Tax=Arctopsyche grandis TaxID=121162 RepID=UPI00406D6315